MKHRSIIFHGLMLWLVLSLRSGAAAPATPAGSDPSQSTQPIAWNELGAKATAQYSGDGLAVKATADGARLCCVFQKLEGDVTPQGLWLSSTAPESSNAHFRVLATSLGRGRGERRALSSTGTVEMSGGVARFVRPGLVEEYSVSVDGLRQDFVVLQRLPGEEALRVELRVAGATAEASPDGARFVLEGSGRKLDYHRLRATDATGRELAARMEVSNKSEIRNPPVLRSRTAEGGKSEIGLAVIVEDGGAVYPVRIDPTFSDANWMGLDVPGVSGGGLGQTPHVTASVADASGNLYVCGNFTWAGDVAANNIAKWDGTKWSALGSGFATIGFVGQRALAVSGTDLYVGGEFQAAGGVAANNIAKWDGTNWSALGSGMNLPVYALAVSGGNLYAGGVFTTAGGVPANSIAKWDGTNWSALGGGMSGAFTPEVFALAVSGSDLYAGGSFTSAGSVVANHIAKWNGTGWTALGLGVNGIVNALAVLGGDLYAGGSFTTADGVTANNIAKWNGSSWTALGSGLSGTAEALAVSGSDLYAGGFFTVAGVAATNIAKWNGSSWSALGPGVNNYVYTLAVSGGSLYAGGSFTTAGGVVADNIAKWNGSNWGTVGAGTNDFGLTGLIKTLAVSGGNLYAGTIPGPFGDEVAKWDGSHWSALGGWGGGPFSSRTVNALAVMGGDLYVGGYYEDEVSREGIVAKWTGSAWLYVGTGMGDAVNALAVSGGNLYAGGDFTTVNGGVAASHIAKWDGSQWSALGSGADGSVKALAVSGSDLYAGGSFDSAGGVLASNIAKWDGSNWTTLGSGVGLPSPAPDESPGVYALAMSGSDLYVGGHFTRAGGLPAAHIAKWDGTNWSALGQGMSGPSFNPPVVYALAVSGSDLYAAGSFTTADGVTANNIAKWNGTDWTALGSGMNGGVSALAVSATGGELYAGGMFTTAGGKGALHVARANLFGTPLLPSLGIQLTAPNEVTISWPSPATDFVLQQNTSGLSSDNWSNVTDTIQDDGTNRFIIVNPQPGRCFYRLVEP